MKLKNSLLCLFILLSSFLSAQEEPEPVKNLFSVRDMYYTTGITLFGFQNGTVEEFRKLAPNSVFLDQELSDYTGDNGYDVSNGSFFSTVAGLNIKNKRKNYYMPSPQVRIGFAYFSSVDLKNSLKKDEITRYDTINNNGNTVYLDTVRHSDYKLKHHSKQLRLDLSVIFRTDRTKRWSVYGGAGLTFGAGLNSKTTIDFHYTTYIDSVDLSGHPLNEKAIENGEEIVTSESFSNKNGLCYSFYFPLGMDLRVGERIKFLRHAHLFYEMRPGFYSISIPELHFYSSKGMIFGFGLRIAID